MSAGDGKVYANLTDTSEVVEIDAKTATVARRWSTAPCKQPVAMAIDTAHHRLFSGCRSGVMAVSDYQAGKVVATVPIGDRRRRRRIRCGLRRRVCLECGRHAHGDSPGLAGPVSRRRERADAAGVAQHGARSHQSPRVRRLREVRTGAGGRQGQGTGAARIVRVDGDRARSGEAVIFRPAKAILATEQLRRYAMRRMYFGFAVGDRDVGDRRDGRRDLTRCSRRPKPAVWAASTTSMRTMPDAGCTFRAAPCRATTRPPARVTVFDLDTLAPVGEIPNTRANGAAVDAKSGHGFASSKPVAMWDTKTLTLIKTIDVDPKSGPDGILADPFNQRIYVFSHPTADATVIDAKDGTVLGTVDLGGAPEQASQRRQGPRLRRHPGQGERRGHRRQDDEGHRALRFRRQGQPLQRAGAGRQESRALRRLRPIGNTAGHAGEADDGDSERGGRQDHHVAAAGRRRPMARCSTRRRWKRSARTATAR